MDCRAAADAMRSEGAAEEGIELKPSPVKAAVTEALGDYLPLPFSQQFPKRGTHKLGKSRPVEEGNCTDRTHGIEQLPGRQRTVLLAY